MSVVRTYHLTMCNLHGIERGLVDVNDAQGHTFGLCSTYNIHTSYALPLYRQRYRLDLECLRSESLLAELTSVVPEEFPVRKNLFISVSPFKFARSRREGCEDCEAEEHKEELDSG